MPWINIATLSGLTEHFTSELACLAFSLVLRLLIYVFYPPGDAARQVLLVSDDLMAIGVTLWLIFQLAVFLWNRRERIGSLHVMVA
jgi:hypothetical protein